MAQSSKFKKILASITEVDTTDLSDAEKAQLKAIQESLSLNPSVEEAVDNTDEVNDKAFKPLPGDEERWKLKEGDIDPTTGQPGELYGAPTNPSEWWTEQMQIQQREQEMREQGIEQDPMLEGTGQPGELYATPGSPEWHEMVERSNWDDHDEAINTVADTIAPKFEGASWMKALDERFEFLKVWNKNEQREEE